MWSVTKKYDIYIKEIRNQAKTQKRIHDGKIIYTCRYNVFSHAYD